MNKEVCGKYLYYDKYRELMIATYSNNKIKKVLNRLCVLRKLIKFAHEYDRLLDEKYETFINNQKILKLVNGVQMYLPFIDYKDKLVIGDYIQKAIYLTNTYFEEAELRKIQNFLNNAEGLNICDIEANIGNHTLYFVNEMHANHVYSFEPVESTFDILQKNVSINLLDNVTLFNVALGKAEGNGTINVRQENNCGANQIIPDENGQTQMITLDSVNFNEKIDFVKMDVEGFEKDVLQGAKRFLGENSPVLFIEIFQENFTEVNEILEGYGYKKVESFEDNYFYIKS